MPRIPFVVVAALALLVAGLPQAASAGAPPARCDLRAFAPRLQDDGLVQQKAKMVCARPAARRFFLYADGFILASGKTVTTPRGGSDGSRRRATFDDATACESALGDGSEYDGHNERWNGDFPVKWFIRASIRKTTFRDPYGGRLLRRKDSRAVPIEELCPEMVARWEAESAS
jgi:hypothetical protein